MEWVDKVFTMVNTNYMLTLTKRAHFLLVKNCFTDPKYLVYVAHIVQNQKDTEVGILYEDVETGHNFILCTQIEFPVHEMYPNLKPLGVAIFTAKTYEACMLIAKKFATVYPISPTSKLAEGVIIPVKYPLFTKHEVPFSSYTESDRNEYQTAYHVAKGMLIGIKIHDNFTE